MKKNILRFAPSPTGFVHIGGLYQSLVAKKVVEQTEGVFFVRIEDTDQKREIENGAQQILDALEDYNLSPDETMGIDGEDKGTYGPYLQSKRKEIYESYAKYLLEQGKAYPCFCSQEELGQIKGNIEFPENDQDVIIIKSDGLPTYHFAHAVDDHLMHTTLVIRSDEWVASVPLHLQLFYCLGFKAPKYAHIAPIMKEENGNKRKLSKRKDPEAAVNYYKEEGIPKESVEEYLMNIANSNFEGWRKGNKDKDISEFKFELNKMGVSGALFDMVKLLDVSKGVISRYSGEEVLQNVLKWSKEYDEELYNLINNDREYSLKVFNIERGNAKPRKDISKWSEVKNSISYMFADEFAKVTEFEYQKVTDENEIKTILTEYSNNYFDINDDKDTWFNKMKDLAEKLEYAREVKAYKENPDSYKGHVGDISTVIRVSLTGRANTPDLYEIMQVLGEKEVKSRIENKLK